MSTITGQHPLKQQIRSIMIVSTLFAVIALVGLVAQNYRALHRPSTISNSSRAAYSLTPSSSGNRSPVSPAGRTQNNPFRGFRPHL
jgi:hypothetical protein